MVSGFGFSPAYVRTGSPGAMRMMTKIPMVTRNATGIMSRRRRRMYVVTPPPPLSLPDLSAVRYFCTQTVWNRGSWSGYTSKPWMAFAVRSCAALKL